ncbi:DUF485 domain-containing protein [Epidermidibacterium keratini]|uniref:DUF485 domain-containing protein n=1 Tax=Epidermidibacterium keratini TaxID=1891644 RepID=A0A7L4YMI6_9ACTN|nr:DUF485 domain-containing protein [Epidermidibacterium keratini]QHC00093.1 DUF485 domain-containing protein [Epidermidibacterium keratini]
MSTEPLSSHAAYEQLHETDEFRTLKHRYRSFAIPWTIAFLAWYLLYVILSNWAPGFMSTKLFGNINVALVFGLLQFVSTFLIAWLYSRHAAKALDPIAEDLEGRYVAMVGADGAPRRPGDHTPPDEIPSSAEGGLR